MILILDCSMQFSLLLLGLRVSLGEAEGQCQEGPDSRLHFRCAVIRGFPYFQIFIQESRQLHKARTKDLSEFYLCG